MPDPSEFNQTAGETGEGRTARDSPPTIVGIGASAGGLAVLKTLFSKLPADSGAAFVIVVHLSPEHDSHLSEILQPICAMRVQQVTRTVEIEPNRVYIIPPNANLSAIDTHLRLSDLEKEPRLRATIDHFFRTLADQHDGHSVGVILTGTGSDGTLGIRRIKESGGVTIAQDPGEAEYDSMPRSAIATGMIDLVLPADEIPAEIVRLARTGRATAPLVDGRPADDDENRLFQKIFVQVRARTGHDFSKYKRSTMKRRIARRMQLRGTESLPDYLAQLRIDRDEAKALHQDLLVTVTEFFRDRAVFQSLAEHVLPKMFDGKGAGERVRVWSVGCSTGEEAYSVAMLLMEEAGRREIHPELQVFASDLHEDALTNAREGVYPEEIAADVSPERLARFFVKEDGHYRVRRDVREMVVFAPHDVLSDPPFSKIDLIICRNLLIYLQRDVQEDLIELFHYALNPEGVLVLGLSETLDRSELFGTQDKGASIYRKRTVPAREPRMPLFSRLGRNRWLSDEPRPEDHRREPAAGYGPLHERMVERHAPPSVLINARDEVVHASASAGRFLAVPGGPPTRDLYRLVRAPMGLDLRAAVHQARQSGEVVRTKPVRVRFNGESGRVVLRVSGAPAKDADSDGFVLVVFDEHPDEPPASEAGGDGPGRSVVQRELEQELKLTRERLQALHEEFESTREEMQAGNEEFQSANEELRSTMEELETSKEELQSMNEELATVNQENRHRVEQLTQLSDDLQNLLAATDIATLFLDRQLRIVRFTPQVSDLFNIRHTDRGRPLTDFTHHLDYQDMQADARSVLDRLVPIEREARDEHDRWYLVRILPYRSSEDRIDGVVITLLDITSRKSAEDALRESERVLALQLDASQQFHDLSTRLLAGPEGLPAVLHEVIDIAARIVGAQFASLQRIERVGRGGQIESVLTLVAHRSFSAESASFWRIVGAGGPSACGRALAGGARVVVEDVENAGMPEGDLEAFRRSGIRAVQSTPLHARDGRLLGVISTHWRAPHRPTERELEAFDAVARQTADLIERSEADAEIAEARTYFRSIVDTLHEPLLVLNPDLTVRSVNPAFLEHFRVTTRETVGVRIYELGNGQWDIPELRSLLEDVLPANNVFKDYEVSHTFEGIGERVMLVNARRLDHVQLILLGFRDITDRRRREDQMKLVMAELNHRVKNTLALVQSLARQTIHSLPDLATFKQSFEQRLRAIAKAHGLLTRSDWSGVSVHDLLRAEIASHVGPENSFTTDGPEVVLAPTEALAVHMVVHELATNARKYGSLKSPGGRVEVRWELAGAGMIALDWTEVGRTKVEAPKSTGYGTALIAQCVEYQLGGSWQVDYLPAGVHYRLRFPAGDRRDRPAPRVKGAPASSASQPAVLIVEDAAAVAMDLRTELERAGLHIAGPAATIDEAMALLDARAVRGAVLDVHLKSGNSFPLARTLRERGIPFVFVTGYDRISVPSDLADVPLLSKPAQVEEIEKFLRRHS